MLQHVPQSTDSIPELIVPHVRSGTDAKYVPASVDMYAPCAEIANDGLRISSSNRQEAATTIVRHRFDPCVRRGDVEPLEPGLQQSHLMLADCSQFFRCQPLLLMESKDSRGSIVRCDVIRGAAEGGRACAVDHRSLVRIFDGVERGEPSSQYGTRVSALRDAEEAIAFTELAVFVSPSCNEHIVEACAMEVERHDVELVIRVDEQGNALPSARCCKQVETGNDFGGLEQYARHHHTRRARIERRDHALNKGTGRSGGHVDDSETLLGKAIDLPADAVELAVSGDDARTFEDRQR